MKNTSQTSFYITTAIDYPNGAPHLGHAYEKIVADAYARWYELLGQKSFLVTGADENGQKLQQGAKEVGLTPNAFVEANQVKFREMFAALKVDYADFIRTSSARNIRVVHDFWRKMQERGDIYFDRYKGHYCLSCESFYAEAQAPDLVCPVHSKPLTYMEQEGYFFKLGNYQQQILALINDNASFIFPRGARQEMLSRLEKEALNDLSISRENAGWGIPVPGDDRHVIYTWFDALISYYAATQTDEHGAPRTGAQWWPAAMHVIGKDISWFHAVVWPAMLMSVGLAMPRQIYVHGMILGDDGRRMSKSLGNGADPMECLEAYPLDSFRYYLLRAIPSGQDGAFAVKELERTHNSDLANDLGNLLMRSVKLSLKYLGDRVEPTDSLDLTLDVFTPMAAAMEQREHHRALNILWDGVRQLNFYLNEKEPWRRKDDMVLFHRVMYTTLANLHPILRLLAPFLPDSGVKALQTLDTIGPRPEGFGPATGPLRLADVGALFPRFEDKKT